MSKLTFDDVISFYPKHNRTVYGHILATQKNGSLIPFVGAGLSVFCGYKLWGAVLEELAEFIPTDDEHQTALAQIQRYEYEQAAQTILSAYPPMLDQLPTIVGTDKLRACPQDRFRTSAAYALPYLFPKGLVMTTNFDRVLETVYLDRLGQTLQIVTPKEQDRLAQLRQNQALGLFKLHGDIGSDTVSIDDLVFTGEQYRQKYADNAPLVQELTRWFENRRLLFLGCSLNVDRTMQVLKQVAMSQSGIRHFAILGCQKSEIPNRLKELSPLGILPIFYDSSNHDAIRVILDRLLEDTDPAGYAELRKASWIAPAVTKEERRLLFDSDYFAFTGRAEELRQLEEFCAADGEILWWAVTGPGGMGKSRLVYEFSKRKQKKGWEIARFEARPSRDSFARGLDELEAWSPSTNKTIVVLDDVQAHIETVCRWLARMDRQPRSEKLRILLLEREGKDLASASWLDADACGNSLVEWVHDENFLCLAPMTDENMMAIMNNFASAAGKSLNAELLLKTLDHVDPELKRPMYAIAIADARCHGKDPTNWDRKEILDTLLKRELKFHFDRISGISDRKIKLSKTLQTDLEQLLSLASIREPLPLDKIPMDRFHALSKLMDSLNMDPAEFFERMGVLNTVQFMTVTLDQYGNQVGELSEGKSETVISLSCPDLIKEHLVLNLAFEKDKLELLFPDDWQANPVHLFFLRKLLMDYSERLKDRSSYWDIFFKVSPPEGLASWIYGDILWGYTAFYQNQAENAADRLEQLAAEHPNDPQIAVYFANGLLNLTHGNDFAKSSKAVDRLEVVHNQQPDNQKVTLSYATGLIQLSTQEDGVKRTKAVDRLEALHRKYPDIEQLTSYFATGLFNLTVDQDIEEQLKAVTRLEALYRENPTLSDIALKLSEGLFNYAFDQEPAVLERMIARIEELFKNHPDNLSIAARLVDGLSYLIYFQDDDDCPKTIERLEQFCMKHPCCEEVQNAHASALVNIALKQKTESEVTDTLAHCRDILTAYPDNVNVQLSYAMTWFNLTLVQQEATIPVTVAGILEYLKEHSDAIPKFKDRLNTYLSEHPGHKERYHSLLDL